MNERFVKIGNGVYDKEMDIIYESVQDFLDALNRHQP